MKRAIIVGLLSFSMGVPMLVGCEREVSHQTKTQTGPNGTSTEEKKVVQNPDGSMTKTETKDSTKNP